MKTIYLVRHGESEANVSEVLIDTDVSLTQAGKEQAKKVADRCSKITLDLVIHSGMQRAKETAEIILEKVIAKHIVYPTSKEILPPTKLIGEKRNSDKQKEFLQSRGENLHDVHYRWDDEETLHEVAKRAESFLKYLSTLSEEKILVVTHAYFLRVLMASVLLDESASPKLFQHLIYKIGPANNTSITVLTYNEEEKFRWKLKNYNDESHLE